MNGEPVAPPGCERGVDGVAGDAADLDGFAADFGVVAACDLDAGFGVETDGRLRLTPWSRKKRTIPFSNQDTYKT